MPAVLLTGNAGDGTPLTLEGAWTQDVSLLRRVRTEVVLSELPHTRQPQSRCASGRAVVFGLIGAHPAEVPGP